MKIDPSTLTKRYYTIGEIAKMFDVNTSLLRYWETVFDELSPEKTRGGKRRYLKEEVSLINDIHSLVKINGYTLEGARVGLKKLKSLNQIRNKLVDLKEEMMALKSELESKP